MEPKDAYTDYIVDLGEDSREDEVLYLETEHERMERLQVKELDEGYLIEGE